MMDTNDDRIPTTGAGATDDAPDSRALKILHDAHWTSKGWRNPGRPGKVTEADFEYAKRAGVMFDAVRLSHDEIVDRARNAAALDRRVVADAFVTSLASRRLDRRSALGSYAVARHAPPHVAPADVAPCPVCGEYDRPDAEHDLSVLSFERFKWGGVRHDRLLYAAFDLERFAESAHPSPTKDDVRLLRSLLSAIESAPPRTTAAALQSHLGDVIRSNTAERDVLVGILGLCGVLATAEHPGFAHRFVAERDRELPNRHSVDMPYPACWWTRADGIDHDAVAYWFGHLGLT